jgi:hypothetical protein
MSSHLPFLSQVVHLAAGTVAFITRDQVLITA